MPRHGNVRTFDYGDSVRVAKRSHVIDRRREHEGQKPGVLPPIEADVTGITGKVIGTAYDSPAKGGETCVPIELPGGAVLAVPSTRLEPINKTPRRGKSEHAGGAPSGVAKETVDFWREYFQTTGEMKKATKKKRKSAHG